MLLKKAINNKSLYKDIILNYSDISIKIKANAEINKIMEA